MIKEVCQAQRLVAALVLLLYIAYCLLYNQVKKSCSYGTGVDSSPCIFYLFLLLDPFFMRKKLFCQEDGRHRNPTYSNAAPPEQYISEDQCVPAAAGPLTETSVSSSSPSGGLACAIAALAERQQIGGDSSSSYSGNVSAYSMLPGSSTFSSREEQVNVCYPISGGSIEGLPDMRDEREWVVDGSRSEVAEVGTSYDGSNNAEDVDRISTSPQDESETGGFRTVAGGSIVPESFEEQMMLAMAVSLAEARARSNETGTAWQ